MKLYDQLIRPLRDQDKLAAGKWLERFLERPQYWHDWINAKIKTLPTLISAEECPAAFLDYLLAIVGFTSRYANIVSRLDENTKRRLVLLAVPMWKQLYTEIGMKRAVRILTGKTPYVRDWFDFRSIIGEVIIGEEQVGFDFWVIGAGALARFDEYTSQIRVMDDGLLDEMLLIYLLEIMRPLNERFEVSLVDFLDTFEEGRSKWTTDSGAPAAVTPELTFRIPGGSVEVPSVPIAIDAAFTDYIAIHKFKITAAGGGSGHQFQFMREDVNNYFYLNVYPGAVNNVELWRVLGGLNIIQATGSYAIAVNAWYKLRTRVMSGATVKVYVDSSKVIDAFVPGPTPGRGKIAHVALVNDVEIDNVELFRNPLRCATIEPSGTTLGPGWVA